MKYDSLSADEIYTTIGEDYFDAFKDVIVTLCDTFDESSEDELEQNGICFSSNSNGTAAVYFIESDDEELIIQYAILEGKKTYQAAYYIDPEEGQDILQFKLSFDSDGAKNFETPHSHFETGQLQKMLMDYQNIWFERGVRGEDFTMGTTFSKK